MSTEDTQPHAGAQSAGEGGHAPEKADNIAALRERLYARGAAQQTLQRHALPRHEIHDTVAPPPVERPHTSDIRPPTQALDTSVAPESSEPLYNEPVVSSTRKKVRKYIVLGGIFFFVVALLVSSFIMFKGDNTISGDNISIQVTGPVTVGGGEELSFEVAIANQNAVPIQSATLVVEYPEGTHSATETDKVVTSDRQQLNTIEANQLVKIPFKARIFGEENQEKTVKVKIQYRVAGSNATFEKESEPFTFKINTSPVVVNFDTVKTITSGQEGKIKLIVQSNSPTPLTNILVKARYPEGFDFSKASPEPVSGEDTWRFDSFKPNEKKVITIEGLITGYENDVRKFDAQAGVASDQDRNALASELSTTHAEIKIEKPFLTANVSVNESRDETVIIQANDQATVGITFSNSLDAAIYDGVVEVELGGNALNEFKVESDTGFYDSLKNTIVWDSVDEKTLKEILPGRSSTLRFNLEPSQDIGKSPEVNFKVTVKGKRVFNAGSSEELVGTISRTIKIESVASISSKAVYSSGPFVNTGPMPPVAEQVTQMTYILKAKAGINDLTGAEIVAVMPTYMQWLDLVSDGNDVSYNSNTRTLSWNIGDMDANSEREVAIQVSMRPSLSQVGTSPTILESQRFKAVDRFTGTTLRADSVALTTSFESGADGGFESGVVRASE